MERALISLLAAGMFLVPPAEAQNISRDKAAYRLADSYVRTGRYEKAVPILEKLYRNDSTSVLYFRRLKDAYAGLKEYNKAIRLLDQRLDSLPHPRLSAEKASLLYQAGNHQQARQVWNQTIQLEPSDPQTYRTVYRSMVQNRLYEEGLEILRSGRERLDQPKLFMIEVAYLYGLLGKPKEAAEAYLDILEEGAHHLSLVKRRLSSLHEQQGAMKVVLSAVRERIDERSDYAPYRQIAAWLYLQTDQYTQALEEFKTVDRLLQSRGKELLQFAQTAASEGYYEIAARAYHSILDRYPESNAAPEALLGLGQMYEKQADGAGRQPLTTESDQPGPSSAYSAAQDAYQNFVEKYPNHPAYPTVLQETARLQLEVFQNIERATDLFREIQSRYPNSAPAHEAQIGMARAAILQDSLDRARDLLTTLLQRQELETAQRLRIQHELALLDFYEMHFFAASSRLRRIAENASDDLANDALELKVLITDNRGSDSVNTALSRYAHARLLARQGHRQRTITQLDTILALHANHGIADDALLLRGQTLREADRYQEAVDTYRRLSEEHPASPHSARSLFLAAQLLEQELNNPGQAQTIYMELIDRYPDSPFRSKAQNRVRALRAEDA